jgi:hypothetical protein
METIEGCFPPTVTIYNFGLIDLKFQKAEFTYEKSKKISMYSSDIRDIEFRMTFDNTKKSNVYSVYISYYGTDQLLKQLNILFYTNTTEKEARKFYNLLIKLKD